MNHINAHYWNYLRVPVFLLVSGKEDLIEHPYVILIHIHDYECQQSNQTQKILFLEKLHEWMYESFLIFERNIA